MVWLANGVFFFAAVYGGLFLLGLSELPAAKLINKTDLTVSGYISILKKPRFLLCYIVVFFLLFTFVGYYETLSRFSPGTSGELFAIRSVGLTGASLPLFTGYFIKRHGETQTLLFGLVLGGLSIVPQLFSSSLVIYLLSSIAFVSAISLLFPTIITFIGNSSERDRGKALSLYSFILLTGASLAPLLLMRLSYQQSLTLLISAFAIQGIAGFFIGKSRIAMQEQMRE